MGKKLTALAMLLALSVFYAYATLGELGWRKINGGDRPLLTAKKSFQNNRTFSLKSGYNFRGSQVIRKQDENVIELNTTMTYRMGGTTYVAPMSRKVAVNITSQNKVSSATVKINF